MGSFEYHLTTDDYAAFILYHFMTSDMGRRQRHVYRLSFAGATAVLSAILIAVALRDPVVGLPAGAFGAVVGWLLAPLAWKHEVAQP